jgi:hypothetical protein
VRKQAIVNMVLCAILAASCRTTKAGSKPRGFVESQSGNFSLWPDPNNIPVCWGDDYFTRKEYNNEVQRYVTEQYGLAGFNFTGWGPCPDNDDLVVKVKIRRPEIYAPVPNVSGYFGTRVDPAQGPVVYLDHTPYWSKADNRPKIAWWHNDKICQSNDSINCVRSMALHEFGHVLGLHHESNRMDSNCELVQKDYLEEENKNATHVGDYDADSIMNYCKGVKDNKEDAEPKLSELDIITLNAYYHSPIVKLDISSQATGNGKVEYTLSFVGKDATQVKYALGQAGSVDCNDDTVYGQPIGISETVKFSTTPHETSEVKICARAGNDSQWQPERAYSAMYVSKSEISP